MRSGNGGALESMRQSRVTAPPGDRPLVFVSAGAGELAQADLDLAEQLLDQSGSRDRAIDYALRVRPTAYSAAECTQGGRVQSTVMDNIILVSLLAGAALGVVGGLVFGNLPIWIGVGAGLGLLAGLTRSKRSEP